jgi:hypothetical protein
LGPNRPPAPAAGPLPGCDCAAPGAGVVFWPKRPPALAAGAAGLAPTPPANIFPAGLVSAGGAPAGVVEPRPPNIGFAGVAWVPAAPEVGVAEPNIDAPPPNIPPVVVGVAPEGVAAAPDPKRPPVVALGVPAAGAAVVVAGLLLPKRLGVPVGVAVPDAGVEVLPNMFPVGLAPPNRPPVEPPAVWPNNDVPEAGAAVEGVVDAPALPNKPPV